MTRRLSHLRGGLRGGRGAGTHIGGGDPGEGAQRNQSPGSVHLRGEDSIRKDGQCIFFENNMGLQPGKKSVLAIDCTAYRAMLWVKGWWEVFVGRKRRVSNRGQAQRQSSGVAQIQWTVVHIRGFKGRYSGLSFIKYHCFQRRQNQTPDEYHYPWYIIKTKTAAKTLDEYQWPWYNVKTRRLSLHSPRNEPLFHLVHTIRARVCISDFVDV